MADFTITWTDLHYYIRNSQSNVFRQAFNAFRGRETEEFVKILNGVSGQIKSGQMMGIMGASGSGKTILMGKPILLDDFD